MSTALVDRVSAVLARRTSRRSLLARTAVVGSAVAVAPAAFLLRPGSAYAAVCGGNASCSQGYTVFCCTVNDGENSCPPGTFVAGWWKADASSYCCDGAGRPAARYYIDCNATCTCSTPGPRGSGYCASSCVECRAGCHDDASTCDNRRVCANYFRYGQCHTEIPQAGPVACRVVTCTPPYALYGSCGDRVLTDQKTADHTAPCLAGACA